MAIYIYSTSNTFYLSSHDDVDNGKDNEVDDDKDDDVDDGKDGGSAIITERVLDRRVVSAS